MESLEVIVARRNAEFAAYKAQQEAARTEKERKARARLVAVRAAADREAGGLKRQAERVDHEARDGKSRRNGACVLDRTGRYSRILSVLQSLQTHFNKNYCFPKQDTILKFLENGFGLSMSKRQLNYDLRDMETLGYIRRKRRISWGKFSSTMYMITKRATRWLSALKKAFGFLTKCRVQNSASNTVLINKERVLKGTDQDSSGVPPPVPL